MTYSKSVLYPQHPTQSLAHNRTLKYFLNEHDVEPVSPTTQQGWKNGNGLPRWAVLVPDAPTVCKTGLGAEIDGSQHLA